MTFFRWLCVFLAVFACFLSSEARDYYQSWVINPGEDYNQWASRYRFLVGDSIIFKYTKGADSVLLVNHDDYNNCSKDNPIKKMDDGSSEFTFDRSGPYYFISGQADHCEKGQKMIVVVLSQRSGGGGGGAMTPGGAPSGHTGGGAMAPGGAPSGHAGGGAMAPGGAPSGHAGGGTVAPGGGAMAPAGGTISPPAPSMNAPEPSSSTAPGAAGPSQSGGAGAPGAPGEADAPGPASNETAPGAGNGNSGSNLGWNVTPSSVWVLLVTLMVSVALSGFIGVI